MPSPRPITWWRLETGQLPMFRKLQNHTVLVIGEEGENILAITSPPNVLLPEFELVENYGLNENPGPTIYTQLYDRLDALVSAGLEQFGTHEGRLYGVIRSDEQVLHEEDGHTHRVLRAGLAYYQYVLEPAFAGELGDYHNNRLAPWVTLSMGLPTWDGPTGEEVPEAPAVPEPEVIRLTRFQRKWVI